MDTKNLEFFARRPTRAAMKIEAEVLARSLLETQGSESTTSTTTTTTPKQTSPKVVRTKRVYTKTPTKASTTKKKNAMSPNSKKTPKKTSPKRTKSKSDDGNEDSVVEVRTVRKYTKKELTPEAAEKKALKRAKKEQEAEIKRLKKEERRERKRSKLERREAKKKAKKAEKEAKRVAEASELQVQAESASDVEVKQSEQPRIDVVAGESLQHKSSSTRKRAAPQDAIVSSASTTPTPDSLPDGNQDSSNNVDSVPPHKKRKLGGNDSTLVGSARRLEPDFDTTITLFSRRAFDRMMEDKRKAAAVAVTKSGREHRTRGPRSSLNSLTPEQQVELAIQLSLKESGVKKE